MWDYCIIGAGISGLTVARTLKEAGLKGVVLEKSRGVGGRMSTRRVDLNGRVARFDHGAQFFTLRDDRAREFLHSRLSKGLLQKWDASIPHEDHPGTFKEEDRFWITDGMNQVARELAKDAEIIFQTRIEKIERSSSSWILTSEAPSSRVFETKMLVVSAPLPQSLSLVSAFTSHVHALNEVGFRPCTAVMLAREQRFSFELAKWFSSRSPLEWMCDNQKKGISELPALTIHFKEDFSKKAFDLPDDEILKSTKSLIGIPPNEELLYEAVHRWRFSQPATAWSGREPFYLERLGELSLLLVGDGFSNGRVEGALLSGLLGAQKLSQK